ncbi:M16 family metallopeptidase [Rufibacter hautae]|uniref:Insulinase family protein n=1 Tax=Rufibacter hautae TaxID=2595005 RepID=A0A5B6TP47_9BACT|nr:pitrilysin family protein [Rufibacter hautae]KAA3438193.1 insulinase family protein [Rufibacter hautae]
MLHRIGISVLLVVGTLVTAGAQTKLIEKVSKKGNEFTIPFEKYKLANGLTLIVHEDHSDPVVHVDVTYHVGSAREEVGKSGFAHFFEHMMFQGTDHLADEEHVKIVSEAGGTMNGGTYRDITNYYETMPSNHLETALWLEADRMGFLLDAVTQQKFEVQRETVKNERGQRVDNQPYGRASEIIDQTMYPPGHPYSWPVIGYVEDLNRVNVQDLKNFFLRWYGPNNATLSVGGDVTTAEVIKLVEKYFGSIPSGPAVEDVPPILPSLNKDRYVSYQDNVGFPMLRMSFPTVPGGHKDENALSVLAQVLGQGNSSIFHKTFVKDQKAISANAYNSGGELAGEFQISITALPNTPLSQTEALLRKYIASFEERGITDDDLIRYKASAEASLINRLASVNGKVFQLALFETFQNTPNYLQETLRNIQAVTKEDVVRVYNQYLKSKPSVILSVVPKGEEKLIARADNFLLNTKLPTSPPQDFSQLKYTKAVDSFDRSKRPVVGAAKTAVVPEFYTAKLKNGLKIIGTKSDEIPTVTIKITVEGGHQLSAATPGKAGISALTASMMNEDTEKFTSEEIARQLSQMGSSVSINSGSHEVTIYVNSLTKHLDKTLQLVEERLLHPKFGQEDFDRLKKQQLEGIANQATQPTSIAHNVYQTLLYGPDHYQAIPTSGTTESVSSLTLDDVKQFYKTNFSPSVARMVIVSDLSEKEILQKLSFLNRWEKKKVSIPTLTAAPTNNQTRIYLVDKKEAAQSEIRIGYLALPYDATGEYFKSNLMNFVLGGGFNSRLNLNLREDKGYTYGAFSGFSGNKNGGNFTAYAGVRADVTAESVAEFMKEIKAFQKSGLDEKELQFLKNSIGQSDARNYETPWQKADFLDQIVEFDLQKDFMKKQSAILDCISKTEVNALAAKNLPADKMHILVVGDKKTVLPKLVTLGYEVVELDHEGHPIKTSSTK